MIRIRPATRADVPSLSRLCGQLGYPVDDETVRDRLAAIEGDRRHAVFVAEEAEGVVIGWIHIAPHIGLLSTGIGEIGGLVVDESERRRGIATSLVEHAERWARENGCSGLTIRSNASRRESHRFYPTVGFEAVKEQKVYRKLFS